MKSETNRLTPRQIRGLCDISQDEMASKVGLSREHYARIENDSAMFRKSKIEIAIKICNVADISIDRLNFFY